MCRLPLELYWRNWGLSGDALFFCRPPYAQSTREKSGVWLLHGNWHPSLFTLKFPVDCCSKCLKWHQPFICFCIQLHPSSASTHFQRSSDSDHIDAFPYQQRGQAWDPYSHMTICYFPLLSVCHYLVLSAIIIICHYLLLSASICQYLLYNLLSFGLLLWAAACYDHHCPQLSLICPCLQLYHIIRDQCMASAIPSVFCMQLLFVSERHLMSSSTICYHQLWSATIRDVCDYLVLYPSTNICYFPRLPDSW